MTPQRRAECLAEIEKVRKAAGKLARKAALLEAQYWAEVRATVSPCGPARHDCEQILGTAFMIYRCRVCGDEEWL